MKKLLVILILTFIIFSVACSANEEITNTDVIDIPEVESFDYNGEKFTILSNKGEVLSYKQDSPLADTLLERIKEVEASYNCEIAIENSTEVVKLVPSSITAGTEFGDIFFIDASDFRNLGNSDYILDIAEYKDIVDYKDSFRWGTKSTLELMTCKGILRGVTPASWIDHLPPYYFVLVANDSIFLQNGFLAPAEYYEKKTWTLDTFEDVVKTCTDPKLGIYGLETGYEFIGRMALYTNGFSLIDENGKNGWYKDSVLDSLNWAADFLKNNVDCIVDTKESSEYFMKNSAALCTTDAIRLCQNIAYAELDSFTVLPFPSGKTVEYGYTGGFLSTNMCCIGIPSVSERVEESARLINSIFAPMDGIESLKDLKEYYTSNLFFHKSDIDIVFDVAASAEYSYWVENIWGSVADITNNLMTKSPKELVEKFAPKMDSYIEDYLIINKQGLDSYFD